MKFLKNKRVFVKLIFCLILCFLVSNGILEQTVEAACTSQQHTEKKGSPEKVVTSKGSNSAPPLYKVTHTYTDGCQYIEEDGYVYNSTTPKLDAKLRKSYWIYNDKTESEKETVTVKLEKGDDGLYSKEVGTTTTAQQQEETKRATATQGGKLLQPIVDLLLTLGDGVMDVIQKAIVGTDGHITLDLATGLMSKLIKLFGVLAAVAVIVAVSLLTANIGTIVAGIGGIVGPALTAIGGSHIVTMIISGATIIASLSAYNFVVDGFSGKFLPEITVLPTYSVSPQEIFEGKLLIFDINFFNPKEVLVGQDTNGDEYYYYKNGDGEEIRTSKQSSSFQLSKVISKWYYTIRNIALVIMMLVLLYVGIRMMLSSIASEKSKYKKMLGDWVISMCLVFVLHYIMVFAVNVNENIVDMLESATEKDIAFVEIEKDDSDSRCQKFFDVVEKDDDLKQYLSEDKTKFVYPTNLVGRMRILCQMQNGSSEYVGYAIAYIVLVLYTIFFTFTYLKRVLYMAFLTVIAPLVAMTYSIDKISDGKAQAFNTWLKEYIFNLLIQPVHLLLYMLLISMAFDLAGQNIIYTLVAIGFMIPAEKLVRKMFGFEKATTPGFLGGAAGAALTMNTMQNLSRIAGKGPGPKGGAKPVGKLDKSSSDDSNSRSADSGKGFASLFNGNSQDDSGGDLLPDGKSKPVPSEDGGATILNGGNPSLPSSNGGTEGDNNLPDYDDIRLAEQKANPMDFLSEDERKEYNIAKASLTNPLEQSELLAANRKKNEIEANAEKRKAAHFQQERANRRMLEESKRRQKEAQEEEARKQAQSQTVGARLKSGFSTGAKKVIENKDAIAKTIKGGTKLTGAVLGGAIGAAAGIASGDIGNAAKYAGLGVTAGNSIGTAVGNGIEGVAKSGVDVYQRAKTEYEKDKYGDKYAQHHKDELDEKFFKDKTQRKFYERECAKELEGLTGDKREEALDNIMRDAIKYRQHGVTDNSLIVKARKLEGTSDENIGAAMLATKAKDMKAIDNYKEDLTSLWGKDTADRVSQKAKKLNGLL